VSLFTNTKVVFKIIGTRKVPSVRATVQAPT